MGDHQRIPTVVCFFLNFCILFAAIPFKILRRWWNKLPEVGRVITLIFNISVINYPKGFYHMFTFLDICEQILFWRLRSINRLIDVYFLYLHGDMGRGFCHLIRYSSIIKQLSCLLCTFAPHKFLLCHLLFREQWIREQSHITLI